MTDYADLLDKMANDTLDAGSFRHVDHIGVAFEALRRHDYFDALHLVAKGIDRAAKRAGAEDKFHATITAAFVSMIAERMGVGDYRDAGDFIRRNADLQQGAPLRAMFSRERLGSDQARQMALLPDL